jgi:hypothetical protein
MGFDPKSIAKEPWHPSERGDTADIAASKHNSALGAQIEPQQHHDLSATVGGDAFAAGNMTSATGVVTNHIEDVGNYTIAFGEAIFTATGKSFGHEDALAAADTFVDVTGADFVLEINFNEHIGNGAFARAESATEYIAVDIPNWSPSAGPIVEVVNLHGGHGGFPVGNEEHHSQGRDSGSPIGNFADVLALADGHGPNEAVSTLTQALTVENHFSLVSGLATVIA